MGAGQSTGGGYRVLQVHPGSPSSDCTVFPTPETALQGVRDATRGTLVTFFDVILSVNGIPLDHEGDEFANEVRANVGKPVLLSVYNTKAQKERPVSVIPRQDWGGEGLLGMHVKYDPLETPQDSALHVVEVAPESPAAAAGLVADIDYIVGCPVGTFENADAFGDFLAAGSDGGAVTLFVLRTTTDAVRAVALEVSQRPWGAAGQTGVGLTLAQGHLHQMPNAGTLGSNDFGGDEAAAQTQGAAAAASAPPAPEAAAAVPPLAAPGPAATVPQPAPSGGGGGGRSSAHWSNGPAVGASPYQPLAAAHPSAAQVEPLLAPAPQSAAVPLAPAAVAASAVFGGAPSAAGSSDAPAAASAATAPMQIGGGAAPVSAAVFHATPSAARAPSHHLLQPSTVLLPPGGSAGDAAPFVGFARAEAPASGGTPAAFQGVPQAPNSGQLPPQQQPQQQQGEVPQAPPPARSGWFR